MDFSRRLCQILLILLQESGPVPINQLALDIKVSKRTVQRELESIDGLLKKYQLKLQSKTGSGIWLEGSEGAKEQLEKEIRENDSADSSDVEERRKRLILEILKDRSPKKLYYYSNIFQVSEATISSDMESIESWFHRFSLNITRRQGYGVILEGSEKNYRLAMREFLEENINQAFIRNLFHENEFSVYDIIGREEEKNVYSLLDQKNLEQVILCFASIQDQRISRLTDNSYIGLILHVTIAVDRIMKKEIIESNPELLSKLKRDREYDLAKLIVNSLEEQFQIEIPDVEIAYIYLHLKGAKYQTADIEDFGLGESENKEEMLRLIHKMCDAYDALDAYELKQDEDFISGLLAHLQPTLVRLRNHMVIGNPLLDQIKENYPSIYKKCKNVGNVLEEVLGFPIPESELGFLVMHFGAAVVRLESSREKRRKVLVGIVCASGIGISRLMLTKIRRFLKERGELTTYGKEDLNPRVLGKTDFFISSISLDGIDADVIMVSPLLVDGDLERIDSKVREYSKKPGKLLEENDFSKQLDEINHIALQIKYLMKDFVYMKVDPGISLEELLVAVTEALSPYKENRAVIAEALMNREAMGTQVIPEYGFALLHARTKGVIRPSFSVCLTKDGEMFSHPYFKKIFAVIIMLMPEDELVDENRKILGWLSTRLIENEKFLNVIFEGNKEKMKQFVDKELKGYFNQYLNSFH